MQELRFSPTEEAKRWLEKNKLMIEDCTLRIEWAENLLTVSVLHEGKKFLVYNKDIPLNPQFNGIDIPGITFPIKFDG